MSLRIPLPAALPALAAILLTTALLAIPAPAQSIAFDEVTAQALADVVPCCTGWARAAAGDLDNDGWPDLVVTEHQREPGRIRLLRNEGGWHFTDRTSWLQTERTTALNYLAKGGPSLADIDNDGDADLHLSVGSFIGHNSPDLLFRNDGGRFIDVTADAGLLGDAGSSDGSLWLDADRDGRLDLYLQRFVLGGSPALRNKLLHQGEDGRFADITTAAGLDVQLSTSGGSGQGAVFADFDGDGLGDLYVAVSFGANRLFLGDGEGGFREATPPDLADPGESFGVGVGDIDNDLRLDLFQPTGAGTTDLQQSFLALNLGGGDFAAITEAAGLGDVGLGADTLGLSNKERTARGAVFADLDNDGDQDLAISVPFEVYANDGNGIYTRVPDPGARGAHGNGDIVFADFDRDGFLDLWIDDASNLASTPGPGHLLRNRGGTHHWLRVEPVGTRSNRDGIGARIVAYTQGLQQVRPVLGGQGLYQGERVVHFGLGERTRVDSVVVEWPSGQRDVVVDLAVDQQVRIVEGSGQAAPAPPVRWQVSLPDTVTVGHTVTVSATVTAAPYDATARIEAVHADLSELGGPTDAALTAQGDGTFRLDPLSLAVRAPGGRRTVRVTVEQSTAAGPVRTWLTRQVEAVAPPRADHVIYGLGGLSPGWDAEVTSWRKAPPSQLWEAEPVTHTFDLASRLDTARAGLTLHVETDPAWVGAFGFQLWRLRLTPARPHDTAGYATLSLDLRTEFTAILLAVAVNDRLVSLGYLFGQGPDLPEVPSLKAAWQTFELPLSAFDVREPIRTIDVYCGSRGTFDLGDLRLVAGAPVTAVTETRTATTPAAIALHPAYPNPFNPETTIPFDLPIDAEVDLAVYNVAGQRVATLVSGRRVAGSYLLHWDGRDDTGRPLASGVYLARLAAGPQQLTRKLLLLR